MSTPLRRHSYAPGVLIDPTRGIVFDWGTTKPADASLGYAPGCIFVDIDASAGAQLFVNEGTKASADFNAIPTSGADTTFADEVDLGFGAPDVTMRWDTSDANANKLLIQMPAGTAVNVPVIVIGQAISDVDMAIHNGVVDPLVSLIGTGAVTTGPVLESRKARGTATAPTVVTSGDDVFSLRGYACVAAGEWVQTAEIRFDCAGTIATTRGPGTITFATATDAAPSVLTTALTISAAQLVTCAAGLTVTTGDVTVTSGNLTFTAASDINVAANTAAALEVYDATTKLIAVDTRNTIANVSTVTITGQPTTIASAGAVHANPSLNIAAKTITYSGTTQTTYQKGAMLTVGVLTITDASALTLDAASSVHINAIAAAGGMLTITASYMISTSVADCYLTNAGAWTDTMCWSRIKNGIERGTETARDMVLRIVDQLVPATWRYNDRVPVTLTEKDAETGEVTERNEWLPFNDRNRDRCGIVYDDLPQELVAPGEEKAISTGLLTSFALAAIKVLREQNQALEARLAKLEAA